MNANTLVRIQSLIGIAAMFLVACGGDDGSVDAASDSSTDTPVDSSEDTNTDTFMPSTVTPDPLSIEFDRVEVASGEERFDICQSFTLNNEEPLFLRRVSATNEGAFHHSTWFFVPETSFAGPDGTWGCDSREYSELAATLAGGVIFTQSTQQSADVQEYPEGVAIRIPPGSKIVGDLHMLNTSAEDVTSALSMQMEFIAEAEVTTELQPLLLDIRQLEVPARSKTRVSMTCDVTTLPTKDFGLYFGMPHYHTLGTGMRVERVGGEMDGQDWFEVETIAGEPWGVTVNPAAPFAEPDALRFSCTFDNVLDETVGWGFGNNEMCNWLGYTSGGFIAAGTSTGELRSLGEVDGVNEYEIDCTFLALPR